MHPFLRDLLRIENYPAYVAIIVAMLGILNDLSQYRLQIILTILGLIAVNTVTERITFFRKILDTRGTGAQLRSREDTDFQHFHQYIEGGNEIFISALSLHYICNNQTSDLENGIRDGVDFKFIIVDPQLPDDAMKQIAEHDERAQMQSARSLRDEIELSKATLSGIKKKWPNATGTITLKAGKGLPVFTITMVNPRRMTGKMRVEMRPYHRNVGPRPYFELRKANPDERHWYQHFYDHYYEKLWDDSVEIPL